MKIREFINKNLGKVRCIVLDEKIYFIGKDVADALGYSNSSKAVSTHCKHIRKEMIPHSQNGNMVKTQTSLIDEGDVYRLIVKSKLPSADTFEEWLFDEVLPQMRATGGYVLEGSEEEFISNYFPSFSEDVKLAMVQDLLKQNKEFKEKANWYDDFMNSTGTYTPTQMGKLFKIGSGKKMNEILHENKIAYKKGNNWLPYETTDKSWYKLIVGEKEGRNYSQLKYTAKGIVEISKLLNIELTEKMIKELV